MSWPSRRNRVLSDVPSSMDGKKWRVSPVYLCCRLALAAVGLQSGALQVVLQ